jgi:hypothetical protein
MGPFGCRRVAWCPRNLEWRATIDADAQYCFSVPYDAGAVVPQATGNSAAACDLALRPAGVSRAAPLHPSSVPEDRDRPQCNIAHQPNLGQIPPVDERLCNERELAPAKVGLRRSFTHP